MPDVVHSVVAVEIPESTPTSNVSKAEVPIDETALRSSRSKKSRSSVSTMSLVIALIFETISCSENSKN